MFENFEVPVEYNSLSYLGGGDIQMVKNICTIWNKLNDEDNLRVKVVDELTGKIIITGKCSDLEQALLLCEWFTSMVVLVIHEPTMINIEF